MPRDRSKKPYTLVGAGSLTATVWKSGTNPRGANYKFNLIRTSAKTGRVTQRFRPDDIVDFAKLIQVLAFTLADDGCLAAKIRKRLRRLATRLQDVNEERSATR